MRYNLNIIKLNLKHGLSTTAYAKLFTRLDDARQFRDNYNQFEVGCVYWAYIYKSKLIKYRGYTSEPLESKKLTQDASTEETK